MEKQNNADLMETIFGTCDEYSHWLGGLSMLNRFDQSHRQKPGNLWYIEVSESYPKTNTSN